MKLFEERQWVGEFFVPGQYEKRFPGKIDYSIEDGVKLSYAITDKELPSESELVYGVLDTGDKCTLIGNFKPHRTGISVRNGLATRPGKVKFYFLAIGDFLEPDEIFVDIYFSLTTLQEFFCPQGFKNHEKFSDQPVFSLQTDYGLINIGNTGSFEFLDDDITAQIYSRDDDALERLSECYKSVRKEYPDSFFMLKKDIPYRIHIVLDAGLTMRGLYGRIKEIADLFSLLIYDPVYPDSVTLVKHTDTSDRIRIELYPSLVRDKRTIKFATRERFHFLMPITKAKIDLGAVVKSWLGLYKKFSTIISSIQNETGFRDEHSLHGEIVLYAAQFESISHSSKVDGKQKYEYPLTTWGCKKITDGLGKLFSTQDIAATGQQIGDLRNEIAHVGRPKELLSKLEMHDLALVSQYMQLTIIGFILDSIGVSESIVRDYQECFCPEP